MKQFYKVLKSYKFHGSRRTVPFHHTENECKDHRKENKEKISDKIGEDKRVSDQVPL